MASRENMSYLVPRDPSIMCWGDRVKLPPQCAKNLVQLGADEFEETMGDKIKVYLRLKPSVSSDNPYTVLSSSTLQTEAPKESASYKNVMNGVGKLCHEFSFTSVLDQDTNQAKVFKKCAVNNLKQFLSGKNYLMMAYGTTSAGKTYTMQGNVEHPGIIPRALNFVFTALKENIIPFCRYMPLQYNEFCLPSEEQQRKELILKNFILSLDLTKYQRYPESMHTTIQTDSSSGFSDYVNATFKEMQSNLIEIESFEEDLDSHQYSVWISMIEIYNEQIYDLLDVPNEKGERPKLKLRDDEYGNTFVKSLRYVNVSSGHEAFQVLQFGRNNLHFAPTALNPNSSRSHCIFTITLAKFLDYETSSSAIVSRFSFCDLAGMERAKKTLNVKNRMVESKAINTSLSILIKCLTTIKENQNSKEKKIIPYRESKLTKLFRDAVMGKEPFSLIVNVTTEPNLFDETLSVLKFSTIAQKIVPQNVLAKPKFVNVVKKSRFSRIVGNSLCDRKSIIDWDVSSFPDTKIKENASASDGYVEELQNLVKSLREQLAQEKKRGEEIERDVRHELTTNFSEMMKKLREVHENRLVNETELIEEMYERREKRIINHYEMLVKKKRRKLDDDLSELEDEENTIVKLEKDTEVLKAENETLKEQMHALLGENKRLVAECSELKFKLVEEERKLKAMKRTNEANVEGGDALLKELQQQLNEANAKISHFKNLLNEAASDYKELEENNNYLRNENDVLEQQLMEQRENVADLKNENAELQKMLSQKRIRIEKLEEASEALKEKLNGQEEEKKMEEIQSSICLKVLQTELKKTSEWLEQSRKECEGLRTEKLDLEKDLEILNLKIADLQSKVLSLEESNCRLAETERRVEDFREELERAREFESKAATMEDKCKELEAEVNTLQKGIKDLISTSKKENERLVELEYLTKENEAFKKELLGLKKRNSELEHELKVLSENFKSAERESKISLDSLRAKLEAVEYQNSIMKSLKDEAERQAYDVPQLQEEIKRLEKEVENREKDMASFNENRKAIFSNYEKELTRLKEENERLRKDVLFANEVIAKNLTPLKTDKAEISRLKESVKKKDDEITKLKAEVESIKKSETESIRKTETDSLKKPESCESRTVLEDCSSRENSPFVKVNKKNKEMKNIEREEKGESTPEKLTKQIENLSIHHTEVKSTRKKVDLLDVSVHPSAVKNTNKGRTRRENGKKEKEKEPDVALKNEKENVSAKRKGKCYKKLFTDNDFDGLIDLNASPLEVSPRWGKSPQCKCRMLKYDFCSGSSPNPKNPALRHSSGPLSPSDLSDRPRNYGVVSVQADNNEFSFFASSSDLEDAAVEFYSWH